MTLQRWFFYAIGVFPTIVGRNNTICAHQRHANTTYISSQIVQKYGRIVKLYFYVNKRDVVQSRMNTDVANTTERLLTIVAAIIRFDRTKHM